MAFDFTYSSSPYCALFAVSDILIVLMGIASRRHGAAASGT
jgi:hypothetical protein